MRKMRKRQLFALICLVYSRPVFSVFCSNAPVFGLDFIFNCDLIF